MEKKLGQFGEFLQHNRRIKKQSTITQYCIVVNSLNDWLIYRNKTIEIADEKDLRDWAQEHNNNAHLYSVLAFYDFLGAESQDKIMRQIIKDAPKPTKRPTFLIQEWQFKKYLSEGKCKNAQHLALLNLLWSELKLADILHLRKSNIHFDSRVVVLDKKRYYLTKDSWTALEAYVPLEERGKNERLFRMTTRRQADDIVREYFGKHNLLANKLKLSCEQELLDFGRTKMFVISKEAHLIPTEQLQESSKSNLTNKLFNRVIEAITNFGVLINPKIAQINDEKSLQRLLEGYLTALFPNEKITSEFTFNGYKQSIIDFTINDEIPLEVKLHGKRPIGDYIREGSAQVREFMRFHNSAMGILLIGDSHRNPKNKKFNGMDNNIHTIII
jgi:hypothetical protein